MTTEMGASLCYVLYMHTTERQKELREASPLLVSVFALGGSGKLSLLLCRQIKHDFCPYSAWPSTAHIHATLSPVTAVPWSLALGMGGHGHGLGGGEQDGTECGSLRPSPSVL